MDRMKNEPVCKAGPNALTDLLNLVEAHLLVVGLPRNLGSNLSSMDRGQYRKDFAAESSLLPRNQLVLETLSIFDGETATSSPSITITPADTTTGPI